MQYYYYIIIPKLLNNSFLDFFLPFNIFSSYNLFATEPITVFDPDPAACFPILDLAQTLLCSTNKLVNESNECACGVCPSCVWFAEGNHPDFRLITPEDADNAEDAPVKKKATKKSQISVTQIRQLIDYLSLSAHQVNSKRVILISPAEALNLASASATCSSPLMQ